MTRTLAFIGDSITDAGRDRDDPTSLGDGYVALLAADLPDEQIVNLGVSGDRATDILSRWSSDVSPFAPEVITLYVGVNDTWRRFDAHDPTSAEAFEETYRRLLACATAAQRVVLIEPFLLPVRDDQYEWLDDLDAKRAVVNRLAAEFGHAVVPLQAIMDALAAEHDADALAPDGVHPSPLGSRIIADAWLRVWTD